MGSYKATQTTIGQTSTIRTGAKLFKRHKESREKYDYRDPELHNLRQAVYYVVVLLNILSLAFSTVEFFALEEVNFFFCLFVANLIYLPVQAIFVRYRPDKQRSMLVIMVVLHSQMLLHIFDYISKKVEAELVAEVNLWSGVLIGIAVSCAVHVLSDVKIRLLVYEVFFLMGTVQKILGDINMVLIFWFVFSFIVIITEALFEIKKQIAQIRSAHHAVDPQAVYEIFDSTTQGIMIIDPVSKQLEHVNVLFKKLLAIPDQSTLRESQAILQGQKLTFTMKESSVGEDMELREDLVCSTETIFEFARYLLKETEQPSVQALIDLNEIYLDVIEGTHKLRICLQSIEWRKRRQMLIRTDFIQIEEVDQIMGRARDKESAAGLRSVRHGDTEEDSDDVEEKVMDAEGAFGVMRTWVEAHVAGARHLTPHVQRLLTARASVFSRLLNNLKVTYDEVKTVSLLIHRAARTRSVNIKRLVANLAETYSNTTQSSGGSDDGAQIELELDETIPAFVQSEPNLLTQILLNLFNMAFDYSVMPAVRLTVVSHFERVIQLRIERLSITHNIEFLRKGLESLKRAKDREAEDVTFALTVLITNELVKQLQSISGGNEILEGELGRLYRMNGLEFEFNEDSTFQSFYFNILQIAEEDLSVRTRIHRREKAEEVSQIGAKEQFTFESPGH